MHPPISPWYRLVHVRYSVSVINRTGCKYHIFRFKFVPTPSKIWQNFRPMSNDTHTSSKWNAPWMPSSLSAMEVTSDCSRCSCLTLSPCCSCSESNCSLTSAFSLHSEVSFSQLGTRLSQFQTHPAWSITQSNTSINYKTIVLGSRNILSLLLVWSCWLSCRFFSLSRILASCSLFISV